MDDDSCWLFKEVPNPADITPYCKLCGKPGSFLVPFEVDHKRRVVIATYRCENKHQWKRVFRRMPICAS